jgi:hypothetical protein
VRLLRGRPAPVDSIELAREVLATRVPDERTATSVLEVAFASDPRLAYQDGTWRCVPSACEAPPAPGRAAPDGPRVLLPITGGRVPERRHFVLREVAAVRLMDDTVVAASGGCPVDGPEAGSLRRELLELLDGAVAILHDPPGARVALERWLEEPLEAAVSLRELGRDRLGLPADHDLETLVAKLDLDWRQPSELLDQAEILDACLGALRRNGESLDDLRGAAPPPLPWHRYAFDRGFLRAVPAVAGTYRFYDDGGQLMYVGKAKNLRRRIGSYFRSGKRSSRVEALLDELHRIEYEPLHSDLEAMLQEAVEIARREPSNNVQLHIHVKGHHRARLRSIMILEPAGPPWVLRAYLIRDGRLVDRVGIGPKGGGLRRIRRLLEDHFFSLPEGPTTAAGPDVHLELVGRWLAANRDRVVAFDPTTLRSADEVARRIGNLLESGELFAFDGAPILFR